MAIPVSIVRWGPGTAVLAATDAAWQRARGAVLPTDREAAAAIEAALKTTNAGAVRRISLPLARAEAVLRAAGVG